MERDSQILTQAAEEYHLEVNGVKFWTPYWINWNTPPYFKDAPLVGKGTPDEIKAELKKKLFESGAHPKTAEEYRAIMLKWGIGIDCSGLACYMINKWLHEAYGVNLSDNLFVPKSDILEASQKPSWEKANVTVEQQVELPYMVPLSTIIKLFHKDLLHLVNVARLTSNEAAITINRVCDTRPGDIIKLTGIEGDHLGVIVKVAAESLRYIESRGWRKGPGTVRYQDITIKNPKAGLEEQDWEDRKIFNPSIGDRLCRLKVIDAKV